MGKLIEITDKESGQTYVIDISQADISITGNVSIKPKAPPIEEPEEPVLVKCEEGPEPKKITNPTESGLTLLWHGKDVFGWDWWIQKGDQKVADGKVKPEGNTVDITYSKLEPGNYKFFMQGNTCKSDPLGLDFTIPGKTEEPGPKPPPPVTDKGAKFEFVFGTTGGGFDPDARYGIKEGNTSSEDQEGWLDRIKAFKFSWGWGITGIALWIHWDGYEREKGRYETTALKRAIDFCRENGLTLSVAFLARRKRNDGFIREEEIVKFSNGELYMEGPRDQPNVGVWAGYGCDRVNALMTGAIKDIAKTLNTYEKAGYMSLFGGHTGELINHVSEFKGIWTAGDFSDDNLASFDKFVIRRKLTKPGRPPMIEGPGIDWPHPDFNQELGREFQRFQTYNIGKQFSDVFCAAVKSVSNIPCIYPYAAASNRQLRATANAPIRYIARAAQGAYGSEGDGVGDLVAKFRVNSVNLGNFPDGISCIEVDPSDTSHERETTGRDPSYGKANPDYNAIKQALEKLFALGVQKAHTAMSFSVREIRNWEPTLKELNEKWIGKNYIRPRIDASNTVSVEVTQKVRNSQDLMEGINPYTTYTHYTSNDYWGGVLPEGEGGGGTPSSSQLDTGKITNYINSNLGAYQGKVLLDIRTPSADLYTYTAGDLRRDQPLQMMSNSKLTTGAVIAILVAQGKLSLDTQVGDVIRSWDRSGIRDITLRQIMGHTSGIPDDQSHEGEDRLEEYVDWLAGRVPVNRDTTYRYSTVSYQVAARMAELVTGKRWNDLFKTLIRDKCQMGNAEYNPRGEGPVYGKQDNPLAGYGLICTQNEWCNFVEMLRDGGKFRGATVMSKAAMSVLTTRMSNQSNWGCGVILENGMWISEAATGSYTFLREGKYYASLRTDSSHETTIGVNVGLRELVDAQLI